MDHDLLLKLEHIRAPDGYKWELVHNPAWYGAAANAGTAEEVNRATATMDGLYNCTLNDLRLLHMKAEAFDEWIEKTEWVQSQQSSFPFNTLGMHRADVMRKEVDRLRARVDVLQCHRLESLQEEQNNYDDHGLERLWREVFPYLAKELAELERLYA